MAKLTPKATRPKSDAMRAAAAFMVEAEARVTDVQREQAKARIDTMRAAADEGLDTPATRLRHLESMQAHLRTLQGITDKRIKLLLAQYQQHVDKMFADLIASNGEHYEARDEEVANSAWREIETLLAERDRRKNSARGGKIGSVNRRGKAAAWQAAIRPTVVKLLRAGHTTSSVATKAQAKLAVLGIRRERTVIGRFVEQERAALSVKK